MKRILITLLGLIIGIVPLFAQSSSSYKTKVDWGGIKLDETVVIGISFEIENATFGGLSFKDRASIDPEILTDVPDAVQRCVDSANKKMRDRKQTYRPQTIFFSREVEGRTYHLHFCGKIRLL